MSKYPIGSYLFLSIKRYTTDVILIQMCSLGCELSIYESLIVLTVYLTEPLSSAHCNVSAHVIISAASTRAG